MKKLILLIPLLGILNYSFGQVTSETIIPSAPTSPQAEAFKQYGEYSINYQTGVPSISIPLFEINHHGYKLPVSLNYFPAPLKPGYNYDVYGHGWGLSVSSTISRRINYGPDEENNFEIESPEDFITPFPYNTPVYDGFHTALFHINYAPDNFSAILPDGSTFDFLIEYEDGDYHTYVSNGRPLKILPLFDSGNITGFEITDENGIKYTFSNGDYMNAGCDSPYASRYVSWLLTQIDLPNSNQPITFSYSQRIYGQSAGYEPEITFVRGKLLS